MKKKKKNYKRDNSNDKHEKNKNINDKKKEVEEEGYPELTSLMFLEPDSLKDGLHLKLIWGEEEIRRNNIWWHLRPHAVLEKVRQKPRQQNHHVQSVALAQLHQWDGITDGSSNSGLHLQRRSWDSAKWRKATEQNPSGLFRLPELSQSWTGIMPELGHN